MTNSTASPNISFRHKSLKEKAVGQITCFRNCRLFRDGMFVQKAFQELWVRDGRVLEPIKIFYGERKRPNINVDCEGHILAPGFLDIQVNGAFGVDFTSLAETEPEEAKKQIKLVAEGILQYGVTGFCPTLITAPSKKYKHFLKLLKELDLSDRSASILGAHFEGPFISVEQSGCHPKEDVISILTGNNVESVYGENLSNLSIVTLAPELEGAEEAIANLTKLGVKVSIGHSKASYEQARKAFDCGASCITHLFNQTQFHHRSPGIVGILTNNGNHKQLYCGIITDGVHLAESTIQMVFCANPRGCILTTDCMSALGLGDGLHSLGSRKIKVDGDEAFIEGTNILAGSVATMPRCIEVFASCIAKLPNKNGLEEALKAATLNPATFLGINERKGVLLAGSDADFVIMDDQFSILATFVGGMKS